ncbi:hypothetical protein D3C77_668990 [compost metagenome]
MASLSPYDINKNKQVNRNVELRLERLKSEDDTDRDLDSLKKRYMKLTKSELADMVIQLEQYIAINND